MSIQGKGNTNQTYLPDINFEIADKDGDGKNEAITLRLNQDQKNEGMMSGTIFYSPSTGNYEGSLLKAKSQITFSVHRYYFAPNGITRHAWTLSDAKFEDNKILIKGSDHNNSTVEFSFSPDEIYDNAIASSAAVLGGLHEGSELNNVFGASNLSADLMPGLAGASHMTDPCLFGSGGRGSQDSDLGHTNTVSGLEGLGTKGRGSGASGYGTGGGHFGSKGEGKIGTISGITTQTRQQATQQAMREINKVLQMFTPTASRFGHQIDHDLQNQIRGFQSRNITFTFGLTIDLAGQPQQLTLKSASGSYEILTKQTPLEAATAEGQLSASGLQISTETLNHLLRSFDDSSFQATGESYVVEFPFRLETM